MLRQILIGTTLRRTLAPTLMRLYSTNSEKPPIPSNDILKNTDVEVIDYDDPDYLPFPEYPTRLNEPLQIRKQRLLYQSRKRGMLENDLLLSTFADKYLENFTEEQTALYDRLINGVSNDWDIYYWAVKAKPTPEEHNNEIMDLLKLHVENSEREVRIRQPELKPIS